MQGLKRNIQREATLLEAKGHWKKEQDCTFASSREALYASRLRKKPLSQ